MISASAVTLSGCSNVTPIVQEVNVQQSRTPAEEAKIATLNSDLSVANIEIQTYLVEDVIAEDLSVVPITPPTYDTSKITVVGGWNNYVITITDSKLDITLTRDSATGKTSSSE